MTIWLISVLLTTTTTITAITIARIVWLAGLKHVLRDSRPEQRPDILNAYASCQPVRTSHTSAPPRETSPTGPIRR